MDIQSANEITLGSIRSNGHGSLTVVEHFVDYLSVIIDVIHYYNNQRQPQGL